MKRGLKPLVDTLGQAAWNSSSSFPNEEGTARAGAWDQVLGVREEGD
jgi:hypothetical protein